MCKEALLSSTNVPEFPPDADVNAKIKMVAEESVAYKELGFAVFYDGNCIKPDFECRNVLGIPTEPNCRYTSLNEKCYVEIELNVCV